MEPAQPLVSDIDCFSSDRGSPDAFAHTLFQSRPHRSCMWISSGVVMNDNPDDRRAKRIGQRFGRVPAKKRAACAVPATKDNASRAKPMWSHYTATFTGTRP